NIGFAAGRFPYINRPFGILPRNTTEEILWPIYQRLIFIEATEIFLRLLRGETLSSMSTKNWLIDSSFFKSQDDFQAISKKLNALGLDESQFNYRKRWQFDDLTLVPKIDLNSRDYQNLTFTIGSHDPLARDHALNICDLDIFNLSFTPPDQIEKIHEEMSLHYLSKNKLWSRNKLPRTVLTFIDRSGQRARDRASACFDTYIEAMRGTVALPSKEHLMARALIGDPLQIIEQLNHSPDHGFNRDDRLMLWFEFNQVNCEDIIDQMALFADKVMPFVS
ncbi:MAG: hypothetical protein NT027_19500, partial [Proteobacteria bacterium]|nr:hypothetical protein [Pseudomonadota bacterium]